MAAHPRRQYSSKIYILLCYCVARQIPGTFIPSYDPSSHNGSLPNKTYNGYFTWKE
jgi:hypothetical protein